VETGNKPEVEPRPTGTRRLLLVAAAPIVEEQTIGRIRSELEGGQDELLVIAPALTDTALEHAMGDVDDAITEARQRLEASLDALRRAGLQARGRVGDADPALAIGDALREHGADKIVIVTEAGDDERWLEGDLFERATQRFGPPIVHIATDKGREVDVERAGSGTKPSSDAEVEGYSRNTPRFSARDLIGIGVALVGTLAAVLIAVGCDEGHTLQRTAAEGGEGSSGSCVAAMIIAGATALINGAHVVGLVLFESAGYRGGWQRFFANLSLVGTPLAVIATLLLAT
jgi:hypothetical protein